MPPTPVRADAPRTQRVKDLMHRDLITAAPAERLSDASGLMRLARLRHLPVVSQGILVGLLSYRDLTDACLRPRAGAPARDPEAFLRATPVGDVMHTEVATITPDGSLEDAVSRMLALRIGCLPVVVDTDRGPRLVGLVTEAELLRAAYLRLPLPD